jgi:phage FluMu gp28-like protein
MLEPTNPEFPGLSSDSLKTLRCLEVALPKREWVAVKAWLSTFHRYQLEWLLDWSRFALLNKARQIGASHTYAGAAVLWGLLGETTTVVSVGEREAIEVLDKARNHAVALARLGSKWAKPIAQSAIQIKLASGGRVLALPSTSGGRSFSGNVLLDEFAYHQHPEKVWDGAGGTVLHGYKLRVMSTPNGVGNLWHQIFTRSERNEGFRKHEVTIDQAIADGLAVDVGACWKQARNDPRVYDQLFRGCFLDGELQYVPSALIDACSSDELSTADGPFFAGLDIGKSVDRTVLIVVRKSGGVVIVQHIEAAKRTSQALLEEMVGRAFKRFELRRLVLDSTGMGAFPAEVMRKKFGLSKVEPVNFTLQVKEDLATALYSAFAEHKIRIPRTDIKGTADGRPLHCDNSKQLSSQLREDVAALRRIITTAGNVRYDAPHTEEGHADSAWALAMALHAALTAPTYARM